jgi:hypothetical protein
MAYILLIIVMTADGVNVQHVDRVRFDNLAACQAATATIQKEIFQGLPSNVKSLCLPASSVQHP